MSANPDSVVNQGEFHSRRGPARNHPMAPGVSYFSPDQPMRSLLTSTPSTTSPRKSETMPTPNFTPRQHRRAQLLPSEPSNPTPRQQPPAKLSTLTLTSPIGPGRWTSPAQPPKTSITPTPWESLFRDRHRRSYIITAPSAPV